MCRILVDKANSLASLPNWIDLIPGLPELKHRCHHASPPRAQKDLFQLIAPRSRGKHVITSVMTVSALVLGEKISSEGVRDRESRQASLQEPGRGLRHRVRHVVSRHYNRTGHHATVSTGLCRR